MAPALTADTNKTVPTERARSVLTCRAPRLDCRTSAGGRVSRITRRRTDRGPGFLRIPGPGSLGHGQGLAMTWAKLWYLRSNP